MFSSLLKVSVLSLALLGLQTAYAAEQDKLNVVVKLDSIKKTQAQEESGDELYFSITEYSSTKTSDHYQVPDFPTHWLSSYLDQVKNVNLWEKELQPNEAVQLIISLVERDVPPWNVDDLIGSLKLKVKWENNQLTKEWSIPNQDNTAREPDTTNTFKLTGDEAQYKITLKVEESEKSESSKNKEEEAN
tara:strand:+ start:5152 stop:5718 length:567 start_codon:yes stop_codon:yes gene_type:complete